MRASNKTFEYNWSILIGDNQITIYLFAKAVHDWRVSTCVWLWKLQLPKEIVYFGDTNLLRCGKVQYQWLLKDLSP
jgi:hypothetical protein